MKDRSNHRTATVRKPVARRIHAPSLWLALGVVLTAGCGRSSSSTESNSGVTNWLRCAERADCDGHPQATCSSDGYCLASDGQRIPADATTDTAADADADADPVDSTGVDDELDASTGVTDSSSDDTCEAAPELDNTCEDAVASRALSCPAGVDLPPTCIPTGSLGDTRVWCCPATTDVETDAGLTDDAGQDRDPEPDETSDTETDASTMTDDAGTDVLPDDTPDASDDSSEPSTDANAACLYLDEAGQLQLDVLHDCLCPGWLSCDVEVTDTTVVASAATTPTEIVCPPACNVARATCEVAFDAEAGVLSYAGVELAFTSSELPTTPPDWDPQGQWIGACVALSP